MSTVHVGGVKWVAAGARGRAGRLGDVLSLYRCAAIVIAIPCDATEGILRCA